jgi:hypothetical protein
LQALTGLEITRNGEPVPREAWNDDLPVDPDKHTIVVKAPGKLTWEASVTVGVSGRNRIDLPAKLDDPAGGDHAMLTAAIVTGGAGAALVIAGTIAGVFAVVKKDEIQSICRVDEISKCATYSTHKDELDAAKSAGALAGNLSTAGISAGSAAIVTAGVLWLMSRPGGQPLAGTSDEQSSRLRVLPALGSNSGGIAIFGRF